MSCGKVNSRVAANSYPDMLRFFVFAQTDCSKEEEKVKFCFNKALLHPTLATSY